MKVLVACEESQAVCTAFRNLGHEAYSCDLQECSGGHPEWHIVGDVLPLINGNCEFHTVDGTMHVIDGKWDLLIAHPPCTYLTVAANKLYNVEKYGEKAKKRLAAREKAIDFFMQFVNADCEKIAIENPVGVISTRFRKPDCIIQPYQFGHKVRKTTCLWLKGLPKLQPTNIVQPMIIHSKGKSGGYSGNSWTVRDENGKILSFSDHVFQKPVQKHSPALLRRWRNNGEEISMKNKLCRKCGRKAIYCKLGLCYCAACYRKIYGGAD